MTNVETVHRIGIANSGPDRESVGLLESAIAEKEHLTIDGTVEYP